MLILSVFTFVFLFFCLPETNGDTILLHRARRVRKLTGDASLQAQSERKQGELYLLQAVGRSLTMPFMVAFLDPPVAFMHLYSALTYSIYVSTIPNTPSLGFLNSHLLPAVFILRVVSPGLSGHLWILSGHNGSCFRRSHGSLFPRRHYLLQPRLAHIRALHDEEWHRPSRGSARSGNICRYHSPDWDLHVWMDAKGGYTLDCPDSRCGDLLRESVYGE